MVHVLIMIHAGASGLDAIRHYESQVVPIIREHGGTIISAFKPLNNPPDEIHLIEFSSKEALAQYQQDSRLIKLKSEREKAIAKTDLYISSEIINYT